MSITFVDGDTAHWRWDGDGVSAIATTTACGNLATHVGDDRHRVACNRSRIAQLLPSANVAVASQVHGIDMHEVGGRHSESWELANDPTVEADMLVTRLPRTPIAVFTADCVPLVVADTCTVIVVHAGWRGLAAGIIQRAVAQVSGRGDVRAFVGPSIGVCCYEVGADVARHFPAHSRMHASGDRWWVDLAGVAGAQLVDAGAHVDRIDVCTRCDSRLHSWRRSGSDAGRQAMIAWRVS